MSDQMTAPADRREVFAPEPASVAAAILLVLSATTIVLANIDSRAGDDYQVHTLLLGSDLALLAMAVLAAGGLRAAIGSWRRHACALAGLALGVLMVPGLVVHPSDRGVAALLRLAGAVALALTLGAARRDGRRLILGGLAVVTLTHVVVALAQRAISDPIGLGSLGEAPAHEIGGRFASTGLTVHPYVLAPWCVVAGTVLVVLGRRRGSFGGLATIAGIVAFAGVGLTMGRAGAIAAVLALAALAASALRGDRAWRTTVAAVAAALVLGLLLNLPGWASRAGETTTGDAENVSNGRVALIDQAWTMFQDNPVAGVGPGRYVLALSERPEIVALSDQTPRPVHLTPLLLLVEGGLLIVPALALIAWAVIRACRRGGAPAVAVALAMLPFLALDHLTWSFPQGIVLTGLWLGALDVLGQRDQAEAPEPEPAEA